MSSIEWRQRRIADDERSFRAISDRLANGPRRVQHLPKRVRRTGAAAETAEAS